MVIYLWFSFEDMLIILNSQIEWKFLLEEMDAVNDLNKANNQEL